MFFIRNGLILAGILLVALTQMLSVRSEEVSYSLVASGYPPNGNAQSLYAIDFATLQTRVLSNQLADWEGIPSVAIAPNHTWVAFLVGDFYSYDTEIRVANSAYQTHLLTTEGNWVIGGTQDSRAVVYTDIGIYRSQPNSATRPQQLAKELGIVGEGVHQYQNWILYDGIDASGDYDLYLMHDDGSHKIKIPDIPVNAKGISSGWFYYQKENMLRRLRLEDGYVETLVIYKTKETYNYRFNFIMNATGTAGLMLQGNDYYLTDEYGNIRLAIAEDLGAISITSQPASGSFSPDGEWFYYNTAEGLTRYRLDGGQTELLTSMPAWGFSYGNDALWHPNGKWLFFSANDQVFRLDLDTRELKPLTDVYPSSYLRMFSPDYEWLIFETSTDFYRISMDGTIVQRVDDPQTGIFTLHGWLKTPTYPLHPNTLLLAGVGLVLLSGVLQFLRRRA